MRTIPLGVFRIPAAALSILLALVGLAIVPTAHAQGEQVTVRAVAREATVKPGDNAVVAVEMKHAPGFHSWPAEGVPLPKSVESTALRTSIDLGTVKGATLAGIQWPQTTPGKVPDPDSGEKVTADLYSGVAVAYLTIAIDPSVSGEITLPITVHYQSCNESMCFLPQEPEVPVKLTVSAGATASEASESALFKGYKPIDSTLPPPAAAPAKGPALPAAPAAKGVAAVVTAPPPAPTIFGIGFGGGLLVLFLIAALGGAVLNLTPCVLPVIPLKIMTLVHHAGTPGKRVALGLWMALGVVTFWFAIGIPMIILRGAVDPSQLIFGTWWVTLGIGLLIAAMGLGIMGLFLFQLPQSVYLVNPKADTAWGSFLFGIMTAVLGLPCFGFVAGGLLAGAAALPRTSIATVFLGLGFGMALPYLVLSIWPALINRIPRTGPASELVKQVMGLLLIAASAWFVAAGIGGLLADMPYLRASLPIWIVSFFVLLAGGWLSIRTIQIARSSVPKLVIPILALAGVSGTVAFAVMSANSDREDWLRAQSGAMSDSSIVPGTWLPYNEARLKAALASGKVVVADFTAEWCINCKVIKRTILDVDPVKSRLHKDDVVLLEVDCTSKASPGSAYLKALGQTGVPTLAVYGPGVDKPLIFNSYLPDTVIAAVESAAKADPTRAQMGAANDGSIAPGTWMPFNDTRFKAALATGNVVVIDFTADWDINCKVPKRTILDHDPVRTRLQKGDVILLEADCSSKTSPGSAYLKALGQTGVPTLAVYGPGVDKPLIFNSYLPDTVIAAVETAKGAGSPVRQAASNAGGSGEHPSAPAVEETARH
jgi:thiol:disulfide interchange protein DsbD